MVRALLVAATLVACGRSDRCEQLRAKYLAHQREMVTEALSEAEIGSDELAVLRSQADKETQLAETYFVGACKALNGDIDDSCFESHLDDKQQRECHKKLRELEERIYTH